jgi:hypothetical protein
MTVELCWRPNSLGVSLKHPKQKPRRGGGIRQINTCRKVPLQVNFFSITTYGFAFYQSNLSTLLDTKNKRLHSNRNGGYGTYA